jgi:gamma-glutamyltranspeptidase/glutathione hydrolase
MNGLGGGGFMVVHRPGESPAVVEFPMVAPKAATPEMFPLAPQARDRELFGWASVVDNRNVYGPTSVAVPGSLAGLALALDTYGSISLAEALEPAIALAEEGVPVTWHWSQWVGRDRALLSRYPGSREIFLDANGEAPWTLDDLNPVRAANPDLARTLRAIADQGIGAFYEGETAERMAAYLAEQGAPFSKEDFAAYKARIAEPYVTEYNGHQLVAVAGASGGTTLTEGMRLLAGLDIAGAGHNSAEALHLIAESFKIAFADRFAYLADPDHMEVPYEALVSSGYLDERRAGISPDVAAPARAGDRAALGVSHTLATSVPEYTSGGSTTHLSVMDDSGMAVSLTQTLLSLWGSRVVVPGTGVMMNNGMMWFDPEPGRPNSVGGGKRPVANMAPALLLKDGEAVAALGASGGRKIICCVAQLAMNLADHGMTMQPATSAPRIDMSTPNLMVSDRIDAGVIETLRSKGHRLTVHDETLLGGDFASPANVQRLPDGVFTGGVDPYYFPAVATGVD